MTRSNDHPDAPALPEDAEAMLRDWPAPERNAIDWEQTADSILAAIRSTEGGTDEALLEAPLPPEDGEPTGVDGSASEPEIEAEPELDTEPDNDAELDSSAAQEVEAELEVDAEPEVEEPKLAAFARAVVDKGQSAELAAMAREGLSLAARTRQGSVPPPEPRAGSASAARLQSRAQEPGPAQRGEATDAEPAADERASRTPEPAAPKSAVIIAIGAVLAAAAALVLYLASEGKKPEVLSTADLTPSAETAVTEPVAKAPPPAAEPMAPEALEKDKGSVLALDELPQEEKAGKGAAAGAQAKSAPQPSVSLIQREAIASTTSGGLKEEAESPAQVADPAAPAGNDMRPAAQDTEIPDKPSIGAVQGALGTVMTGARACLAGQEAGSKATITFGSDGHVRGVQIAGPAAGTPAEACLRGALGGARVSPFAQPDFAVSITVRPP